MRLIGLCGRSGSGKSLLCQICSEHGIKIIDCDAVYHVLLQTDRKMLQAIENRFPGTVEHSRLQRKKLGKIVFSDETGELLKKLNRITHSRIIDETENRIKNFKINGERAVIFDAPLLFESGFDKKCDIIITVIANAEDKIKRIMQRDDIDFSRASARINSQLEEKYLVERSNYVIKNVGDVNDIDLQVEKIIKNIFNCEV